MSLSMEKRSVVVALVGVLSMVNNVSGYMSPDNLTHKMSIVEDEAHCDFVKLRDFLTRTHLQDLIETTAMVHYESFRTRQLLALKESTSLAGSSTSRSNTTATRQDSTTGTAGASA